MIRGRYHNQFEEEVAGQFENNGWSVFNTNNGFPDLFMKRNDEIMLVECKNGNDKLRENQEEMILKLKENGVNVKVVYSNMQVPDYMSLANKRTTITANSSLKMSTILSIVSILPSVEGNKTPNFINRKITGTNIFDVLVEQGIMRVKEMMESVK